MSFDARGFITKHFETAEGVIATCQKASINPPKLRTVQQWMHRRSIPGAWLASLVLAVRKTTGREPRISDFMEG